MATFRCKRSGNTVSFANDGDIESMRKHEGYEEVKDAAPDVLPDVPPIVEPQVMQEQAIESISNAADSLATEEQAKEVEAIVPEVKRRGRPPKWGKTANARR